MGPKAATTRLLSVNRSASYTGPWPSITSSLQPGAGVTFVR
jgi:hypothetical protein